MFDMNMQKVLKNKADWKVANAVVSMRNKEFQFSSEGQLFEDFAKLMRSVLSDVSHLESEDGSNLFDKKQLSDIRHSIGKFFEIPKLFFN